MSKYIVLMWALLCLVGCQTTRVGNKVKVAGVSQDRNEKLLLRVDQIVGTYEVTVQRAVLNGKNPAERDQWSIMGSTHISGYPETFRFSEYAKPVGAEARQAAFLLDGKKIEISQEPGVHLIAKVIPELQNTARVVGVYVQVISTEQGIDTFSMPFDITCNNGEVISVYSRTVPVL